MICNMELQNDKRRVNDEKTIFNRYRLYHYWVIGISQTYEKQYKLLKKAIKKM